MRLSDEQYRQFWADGFLIVRELFTAEEMALMIKIAKADQAMAKEANGRKDAEGGISRLRLRNELYDDIYSAVVQCRRVADAAEQLMDDEVYHFHHKMMLKEPRVGGAWEWHQDYGYWYLQQKVLFPDMLSVALAVDGASKDNGCLQVIRGSHKCGRIHHGVTGEQTGADMEKVNALLDFYKLERVYAEMAPGDALFFHCNTLHRSDQNRSEKPRWTLISCYNTKHNDRYDKRTVGHPAYHPLPRIEDDQVLEIGKRQWEQMQASVS